jgi:hypothetical protein
MFNNQNMNSYDPNNPMFQNMMPFMGGMGGYPMNMMNQGKYLFIK